MRIKFFPVDKPVSYPLKASKVMRSLKKHKYIYTHSTLNISFTHSRINASHVFFLNVRLLRLKSSARNHRNYLVNELHWKSRFSSCTIAYNFSFYYNHWWSLQSYWLSAVWFIHESHYFCFKSHLFKILSFMF